MKRVAQGAYRTSNWEAAFLAAGAVLAAIGLMCLALALAGSYANRSAQEVGPAARPLTFYIAIGAFVLAAVSFVLYVLSRRNRRHGV